MDFHQRQDYIKQSYIVCSTGRSGSTLLCKTLKQLNLFGNPEEYFHYKTVGQLALKENPSQFIEYLEFVLQEGRTENGTFAIKMHWWQLDDFLKVARQVDEFKGMNDIAILNFTFPNLKFIYIWRQDMTAQAVSTEIALQTGVWVKNTPQPTSSHGHGDFNDSLKQPPMKFRPLRIYKWEQRFRDQNKRWQIFFTTHQIKPHELTYERLTANFESEIAKVVQFLGSEPVSKLSTLTMPTRRQANAINEKFTNYYKAFPTLLLKGIFKLNVLRA